MTADQREGPGALRADARANRDRIVIAAREVFTAAGVDAPLDDVARAAGVGKGTLYRRFPDRHQLLAAVAHDTFQQLADLASRIQRSEPDPWIALCHYLREWFDLRLGVIYETLCDDMPAILAADPELRSARATWLDLLERMVTDAQKSGRLRTDVRAGDIALFMNLLHRAQTAKPLLLDSAERFLELTLDGLSVHRDVPLPGTPLTTTALTNHHQPTGQN